MSRLFLVWPVVLAVAVRLVAPCLKNLSVTLLDRSAWEVDEKEHSNENENEHRLEMWDDVMNNCMTAPLLLPKPKRTQSCYHQHVGITKHRDSPGRLHLSMHHSVW